MDTGSGAGLLLLPWLASAGLQLSLQGKETAENGWHWRQGTGLDEPLI